MAHSRAHVEAAALQLDAADRARLVDVLVTSLAVEHALDDLWFAEVERRVEALGTDGAWGDAHPNRRSHGRLE